MNNFEIEQMLRCVASAQGMDQKMYDRFFSTMISLHSGGDRKAVDKLIKLQEYGIAEKTNRRAAEQFFPYKYDPEQHKLKPGLTLNQGLEDS